MKFDIERHVLREASGVGEFDLGNKFALGYRCSVPTFSLDLPGVVIEVVGVNYLCGH